MDETRGDSRYPPHYRVNQGLNSTHQPNVSVRNVPHIAGNYVDLDDDEEDDEEQEQEANTNDNGINGSVQQNGDNEDNDDTDDDNDDEDDRQNENFNLHRHPKKRKLKSLLSSFELVPRVPTPAPLQVSPPIFKVSFSGRNALTDWTEIETFALLDSWGERFVKRGRKSLRSEEWLEVADKVARVSRIVRTDTQCRNRVDTLKKKYKKEKALLQHNKNATTRWVYFKKMDMLIAPTLEPQPGPLRQPQSQSGSLRQPQPQVVYLNSPGNTVSEEGDDDDDDEDSDVLPPKKPRIKENKANVGSFKLLADSINRFSDVYEKIETRKRKELLELEKMRMDFFRELELQKNQILERAHAELVKIRRGEYQENDSVGNVSGVKAKKKASSSSVPSESSAAATAPFLDLLVDKRKTVHSGFFSQKKEDRTSFLEIKQRQMKIEEEKYALMQEEIELRRQMLNIQRDHSGFFSKKKEDHTSFLEIKQRQMKMKEVCTNARRN